MINIYCRAKHHGDGSICSKCEELLEYAKKRLLYCPFQHNKPTCGNCLVHCYKPAMKEKVVEVMRFSGPRMIYKHPFMALRHLLDSRRKPQKLKPKSNTK